MMNCERKEIKKIVTHEWQKANPNKVKWVNQNYWNKNGDNIQSKRRLDYKLSYEIRKATACRSKVKVALKKGVLKKPDKCENCQHVRDLIAHHFDYNRPLDVNWVCRSCHSKIHQKLNSPYKARVHNLKK